MKKQFLAIFFLLALPLLALPPKTDVMIRSLITGGDLATLIDKIIASHTDSRTKSSFTQLHVEQIEFSDSLREFCHNSSRSGAALKITIDSTFYYLSTSGPDQPMKLCGEHAQ